LTKRMAHHQLIISGLKRGPEEHEVPVKCRMTELFGKMPVCWFVDYSLMITPVDREPEIC